MMAQLSRRFVDVVLGLGLVLLAALAQAHPSAQSQVLLDVEPDQVRAEVTLPLDQLKLALGRPVADLAANKVLVSDADMAAYLVAHLRPLAPDGRAWLVKVNNLHWMLHTHPADLVLTVSLRPPTGAPVGDFTLNMDAIGHQVPNHVTMVALRLAASTPYARPRVLGALRFGQRSLKIVGADQRWWAGSASLFKLGMTHIAEGADHLLFLLTLLLPAALVARDGKWDGYAGTRRLLLNLAGVVTAFTIGHSLTLLLGATGQVTLPTQPVEVAIAVSILVSAVHVWRPLFAGRECWIGAAFGLVHGLAFSGAVRQLELSGARLVAGVLAFNLGIETVQAIIVAVVAPLLVLLARTGCYHRVRQGVALMAGSMALVWMAQRAGGMAMF